MSKDIYDVHDVALGEGSIQRPTPEHPKVQFQLTKEHLQQIAPVSDKACEVFLPHINKYALVYNVDTPLRMAMFLAQVLHESECFKYTREIWGPTAEQQRYERDMKAAWNDKLKKTDRNYKAYHLGNVHPGDGKFFKGHGLIQVTGRANHFKCSYDLFKDDRLIKTPELLTTPEFAVLSAYWFWDRNKLNELSELPEPLEPCTKRINGGKNGIKERGEYYSKAIEVFKA